MTNDDNFDLDALSGNWQSDDGPDTSNLRQEVRQTIIQSRIIFIFELLVSGAGLIVGLFLLLAGNLLVGAAAMAFSGFAGAASLITRVPAWRISLRSVLQETDVQERQNQLIERAGWAGLAVSAAAILFLVTVLVASGTGLTVGDDLLVIGAGSVFILGSALWSIRTIRKAKRRAENLRATRSSMGKDD